MANVSPKPDHLTAAHAGDELVSKTHPLIKFRGQMDHAEATILVLQTRLAQELDYEEGSAAEYTAELIQNLQDLLDALRACVTAEARQEPVAVERVFGLTLDELQERSHHSQEYYGVPTMTRPDWRMGETYAGLNLIRTEIRQAELAAAELDRPDILHVLNRLSSGVHALQCKHLKEG